MKKYSSENIRNVAFISHGGAGKTSLTEALLFSSGAINRLGKIEAGNTTTDYDPDEIKKQVTINVGLAPLEWDGIKINLLDTPGYFDFIGDVLGALRVADSVVTVVCAVSGVEVGTEKVWGYANDFNLPRFVVINKLQDTATGDTLCDRNAPIIFPPLNFPEPVISFAVEPKTKGDEDKVMSGLSRFLEEDPTFKLERKAETKQTVISGLGELHLEIIVSRLAQKFGVEVDLSTPKVPYKETIRGQSKVEGKHKKQSGGRGQFGHVFLELEPAESGQGLIFEDKIFGGSVPRQYIPAVEKGVREAMEEGVVAGYPVVDIVVRLVDGSYHTVDSSEMAFKIASSQALRKGMEQANPVLLEPIMNVEVIVPEAFMGDIMGDLNSKRGRILGMEAEGGLQKIRAQVPMAEMFKYSIDLRSMTQGRGFFTMSFSHYEEVPHQAAEQVVAAAKAAKEEES